MKPRITFGSCRPPFAFSFMGVSHCFMVGTTEGGWHPTYIILVVRGVSALTAYGSQARRVFSRNTITSSATMSVYRTTTRPSVLSITSDLTMSSSFRYCQPIRLSAFPMTGLQVSSIMEIKKDCCVPSHSLEMISPRAN